MLERLFEQVSSLSPRRLILGYSGGVDSQLLLHLLYQLQQLHQSFPEVIAVHVNHGLQKEADDWQTFCKKQCNKLNFAFIAEKVTLTVDGNIEEQARKARFIAFKQHMREGDILLLAHHANDQAETVLYRLFRGAGVKGLSGIQQVQSMQGMQILRPLLGYQKRDIEKLAKKQGLDWVKDNSNADERFDRNFLRNTVLPAILKRWPAAIERINKTASHLTEADELLNDLAKIDWQTIRIEGSNELPLDDFALLSDARQKNLLGFWLVLHDLQVSEKLLDELFTSIIAAKAGADPVVDISGKQVRRFKNALYVISCPETSMFEPFRWNASKPCIISGFGQIQLVPPLPIDIDVCPREGGERIQLPGVKNSKSLKNFLQEQQIPPWQRMALPLLYQKGKLLAVADLVITEEGKQLLGGCEIVCVRG